LFPEIPEGVYAVAVCHDEDGNGECAVNLLGLPKEGVGVSNDVLRRLGPPRFEDAKFRLESLRRSLEVRLAY
jgi:uncharacterized protein (DUF2141 family)